MFIPVKDILRTELSHIEPNDIAILALVVLYHNNLINDKQLTTHASRYKTTMLNRYINSYHSHITDKWYNEMRFNDILSEIALEKCVDFDIEINVFLKYLNKAFSRNRNYCINHLYFMYIVPLIERIVYNVSILNAFKFEYTVVIDSMDNFNYSGIYDDVDDSKSIYYTYLSNKCNDVKKHIINELLSMKTHNKNIYGMLEVEYNLYNN